VLGIWNFPNVDAAGLEPAFSTLT